MGRRPLRGRGRGGAHPGWRSPGDPCAQLRDQGRRRPGAGDRAASRLGGSSGTRRSASGAATPATSPTPTATAGRSPTTPARSARPSCPDASPRLSPDFAGRAACLVGGVTDDKTVLTEDDVAAEQLVAWSYDAAEGGRLTATFDTGDFATGLRAHQPDRRGRRGGQPPPRPDADLPDARRPADQPRRRRGDRPRRPDGALDHRARRGSRRDAARRRREADAEPIIDVPPTTPSSSAGETRVPDPGTPVTLG